MDTKIVSLKGGSVNIYEEDDLSLITRMACKDIDPEGAEAALTELFRRYHKLYKDFAIKNKFRCLGWDVDDFVTRMFQKAYERAETFKAPPGLAAEKLTKKVQAWLFEIMRNEFLMELRRAAKKDHEASSDENTDPLPASISEEEEEPRLTGEAARVRAFLEFLPKPERELLEISMKFYDFKAKKAIIPEDILQGLAESLGTTPENIKQKRKRLLSKLKDFLEGPQ